MQYIIAEETKGVLNMREYVTPRMTGETFASNEYISVCWAIACDWGILGKETGVNNTALPPWLYERSDATHTLRSDGSGCGHEDNQYITENENGSFSIMEINTQGLGDLNTKLTKSSYYRPLSSSITDVKPGDMIYWTTSSGNRTWYHSGRVSTADYGHPNRS